MTDKPDGNKNGFSPVMLLLLIPFLVLWVPLYNTIEPTLFGFPFLLVPARLDFRQHDHHGLRLLRDGTALTRLRKKRRGETRHATQYDGLDCFRAVLRVRDVYRLCFGELEEG
jgi:hypothetical protein